MLVLDAQNDRKPLADTFREGPSSLIQLRARCSRVEQTATPRGRMGGKGHAEFPGESSMPRGPQSQVYVLGDPTHSYPLASEYPSVTIKGRKEWRLIPTYALFFTMEAKFTVEDTVKCTDRKWANH